MDVYRRCRQLALAMAATVLMAASSGVALAGDRGDQDTLQLAQAAAGTEPRELEPRYKPVPPPEPEGWYNSGYVFGLTRGVAGSTMVPAAKAPLFLLTIPLDIVILPFAAIGGLFG